ncbi:MAG: hypothetical protein M9947_11075 [Thermomicrobiales bacterium]|nr:hypothetical protein [Thermomicrobiales bacterium]
MNKDRKRFIVGMAIILLVPLIVIGGFGLYGLSQADKLPWQTPPTRIPVTPVEMPSFGTIGGTPVPTTVPESDLTA